MNQTTLTLLGDFCLSVDGVSIALPTRKAEALLAYLALHPDARHTREKLAGLLWGGHTDAQARHNLRQCLSHLRKALGSAATKIIDADQASIMLRSDAIEIDVGSLQQILNGGQSDLLQRADQICNGELLANLNLREEGFDDWLSQQREAARKLQSDVLLRVTGDLLANGDAEAAVAVALKLAHMDALDEAAQRLLMRAYAAAGQRSAALAHYQTTRVLLADELGIEPEADTLALRDEIKIATTTTAPAQAGATPPADRHAIAVLPFDNMSGDPEQEYFADGIVEDIISTLSRYRWFPVVARNSSFSYKGRAVDATRIGQELGARYLVEGSVRKGGDQVRITVQLIDAESGNHIWAQHYDSPLDAVFTVQDEITEAIVAAMEPELGSTERTRAKHKPPDSLDAWDCYHRGLWHLYLFTRESNAKAQQLMRRAISMDTGFTLAYAGLADSLYMEMLHGYSKTRDQSLADAFDAARQAVALDDQHAGAHFSLGRVYYLRHEHDAAIASLQTAVTLNPSFADAYYGLAFALVLAGRPNEALDPINHALRLSPHDPYHWIFLVARASALMLLRRFEEAVVDINQAARHPGAKITAFIVQAGILALVGRDEEARAALATARQFEPELSVDYIRRLWPLKNPGDLDEMIEALRELGLRDGGAPEDASPA